METSAQVHVVGQNVRIAKKKSYSFSAVFTGDDSTKIKIRKEFLKFIALAEDMANKCPKEQLYQLNFDLHDWL